MPEHDATVLCIDDEPEMLKTYRRALRSFVSHIELASDAAEGVGIARDTPVDVVLLDLKMPGTDGLAALRTLRAIADPPEVIIVTGYGSVQDAVAAMKRGAADFIEKPFTTVQLKRRIEPLLRIRELETENRTLRNARDPDRLFPDLVGTSEAISDLKTTLAQLAQTNVTVTILGESGTGKELVARALHEGGPRRGAPFVVVDCGALPETMIESELFGYRKGAFTGAQDSSRGLFRAADGGTLFLDEIAELPLPMQTRLLRSVQNREIRPVGATEPIPVDVRIVAATNTDLRRAVEEGRFREDLFYRLTAVIINVPALRDHPEDIVPLANHFAAMHGAPAGESPYPPAGAAPPLDPEVLATLQRYRWPGNVRELENVIHSACALSPDGTVRREHLRIPTADAGFSTTPDSGSAFVTAKDMAIDRALTASAGNKRQAAAILGVAESTIYRNLKRRGLL